MKVAPGSLKKKGVIRATISSDSTQALKACRMPIKMMLFSRLRIDFQCKLPPME